MFSRLAVFLMLFSVLQAPMAVAAEKAEILFIQMSDSMEFDGQSLILSGVKADIVWFTQRPLRKSGHVPLDEFLSHWKNGTDSFETDPPNAVVTIKKPESEPAIVELKNPRLTATSLTYDVTILSGSLPSSTGPVSLVIDGRVAGVNIGL